jgi:hypothetical protein
VSGVIVYKKPPPPPAPPPAPASPQGGQDALDPLMLRAAGAKLRASGEDSLRAAEACKAPPRAGYEAHCLRFNTDSVWRTCGQ